MTDPVGLDLRNWSMGISDTYSDFFKTLDVVLGSLGLIEEFQQGSDLASVALERTLRDSEGGTNHCSHSASPTGIQGGSASRRAPSTELGSSLWRDSGRTPSLGSG